MDRRKQLLLYGQKLFGEIANELDALDARPTGEFRRESDHEEICLALALLRQKDPREAAPAPNLEAFTTDDRQRGPI